MQGGTIQALRVTVAGAPLVFGPSADGDINAPGYLALHTYGTSSATVDSGLSGSPGFTNDGDNEITGIHVSDGDPSVKGILGAKTPQPFRPDGLWRVFWTQQHGDNITWELIRRSSRASP
jgi:hypothetical protein